VVKAVQRWEIPDARRAGRALAIKEGTPWSSLLKSHLVEQLAQDMKPISLWPGIREIAFVDKVCDGMCNQSWDMVCRTVLRTMIFVIPSTGSG